MTGNLIDARDITFVPTDFSTLMQKRIYRLLIVCSNYDFFILEEDGRIEEQIFNEYNALNFRFPPVVIHADSEEKASSILESIEIDLVILMLNPKQRLSLSWVRQIKKSYPHIPLVALVYFSREIWELIARIHNLIDYVFCWQGNADLLVAIIKLIEDKFNAEHDILQVGAQAILVVEDSIQYISTMLPLLYKIIVWQSQQLAKEGLNEHQKMLRLRGRPKILLCRTSEEAMQIYTQYHNNILGVISDVTLKHTNEKTENEKAGVELCEWLKKQDAYLPIILQSSDIQNRKYAEALNIGFIDKHSRTLTTDYQKFISNYFSFGDFVFRNPYTGEEYKRVSDLYELQHTILNIPDEIFAFHARRNDFSKWLNARALFGLGKIFRNIQLTDFSNNIPEIKKFVYEAIAQYRISKSRGVIARYEPREYDQYISFSRIGSGSIGGKGRGLAFADNVLKRNPSLSRCENIRISIPRTVVIATDIFDEFLELNNLFSFAISTTDDKIILDRFVNARLPEHLILDLQNYLQRIDRPIAVRSSSKLEDSQLMPFAGVYKTYMIPYLKNDLQKTFKMLCEAIKCVYASLYYSEAKSYFQSTGNNIADEKMGVILQEVCGQPLGENYFPLISGVAISYNFYPIPPEEVSEGIVHMACGLGKYVVEGGECYRFSPLHPLHSIMGSSTEMIIKNSQKNIYALSLNSQDWQVSADDKINIVKLTPDDLVSHPQRSWILSKFDLNSQQLTENLMAQGKTIITFNGILKHKAVSLPEVFSKLLPAFEREMHTPVEIEFAFEAGEDGGENQFYILQVRPMHDFQHVDIIELTDDFNHPVLVYSTHSLGNGIYKNIHDVIYVKPEKFDYAKTLEILQELNEWNTRMRELKRKYVLIGPGRWGSSDPWLGIPVRWHNISESRVIVETISDGRAIDFSEGTHLFYNLISSGIAFLMVDTQRTPELINYEHLKGIASYAEGEYTRWIAFESPITIMVDGRTHKGIIYL